MAIAKKSKLRLVYKILIAVAGFCSCGIEARGQARPEIRDLKAETKMNGSLSVRAATGEVAQKSKAKWEFIDVAPGVKSFGAVVNIQAPAGKQFQAITGPQVITKPEWFKTDGVSFVLGMMKTKIQVSYKDGSREIWIAEMKFPQTAYFQQGCSAAGLKMALPTAATPPVFFAAVCTLKEDRVIFNPSVPGDLDWDGTTIFETDGKGERWKVFEISRNNLVSGDDIVANLGFRWKGQKTGFFLMQNRGKIGAAAEKEKDKKKELRSHAHLGFAQFSAQTPIASARGSGPFAGFDLLTPEIFWGLRFTGDGNFIFPLGSDSSFGFTGGIGKVFGDFKAGKSALGIFGEYAVVSQSHTVDGKNISFQHSQLGFSATWNYALAKSEIRTLLRYNGLGGASQSLGAGLGYEWQRSVRSWGVQFTYGSQSAKSAGGTSSFNQLGVGAQMSF